MQIDTPLLDTPLLDSALTPLLHAALPTIADVECALGRIGRVLPPTPLIYSPSRHALLKLENLQATGAYKVRGALNAALCQLERGDRRPLVAASAGNHGQGVAWAARRTGLRACVVVPHGAPETKREGIRALGAELVDGGPGFEECLALAQELAIRDGSRLVHAFDDADVIAGQGTVALELLAACPEPPDAVVVPIGGGGLAAGVGLALQARGVRVIGVQLQGLDAMRRALQRDEKLTAPLPVTIADGVRVRSAGALTARVCAKVLDDIVLVSEDEVRAAVVDLAMRDKVVAEGAGALAVAALSQVRARRPVAVVSGGNIDFRTLGALGN